MLRTKDKPATLAGVIDRIKDIDLPPVRERDTISAVNRLCAMARVSPAAVLTDVPALRRMLAGIRPARHDIAPKTFSNVKSQFRAALELAGVIDPIGRGHARRDPHWGKLLAAVGDDRRIRNGLAAFANWCVIRGFAPDAVDDQAVQDCLHWLESRTLCPKPRDIIRRVPNVWNDARKKVEEWPRTELNPVSFRQPQEHLTWKELPKEFWRDAQRYLAARENPDLFDERPNAPRRPLAGTTLRQQREHVRLAASILVRNGTRMDDITSLADLVQPEPFKTVLRHYHEKADGNASAFAVGVAKTLQQVAKYHAGARPEDLDRLKTIAAKLPPIPFDLTERNKALLQALQSGRLRAKLLHLPDELYGSAAASLDGRRLRFVDAQVAVAVEILLVAPLRPQNLIALNWRHHFQEPDGSRGRLMLYIPKDETKTKERELVFELPERTARLLRWYRRHILPRLGASPDGPLFVTDEGAHKAQETITDQIIHRIDAHVGLHISPHKFRHVAAALYLEAHPQDFRTVTDLLGHASAKTTLIYAGVSSERASKVYTNFILEQRKALKLKRPRRRNARRSKEKGTRS